MLVSLPKTSQTDELQRPEVWWETAVYRLPDDGTGTLPTLRHVIVNDNKSSTYKLGLLRPLVRIADSAPGLVLERTYDYVELPLGAVGLFWVMLYHPLVLRHDLRQSASKRRLGFATNHFKALTTLSVRDLRPGQSLSADVAPTVLNAIRDASANILKNPAHFTTWPGTNRPIFDGGSKRVGIKPRAVRLDRETLARFGRFRVPVTL